METYQEYVTIQQKNITGEVLSGTEYMGCRFEHCVFENSKVSKCRFTDCVFSNCRITTPTIEYTVMTGSRFEQCRLFGINWSQLSGGYIRPIDCFDRCQLKYNHFLGMEFSRFEFSDSDILASMFADCNLSDSHFRHCKLDETEFFRCDLTNADFREASGYRVDLSNCKLQGAAFSFPEVVNLLGGLGIVIE